MPQADGQRRPLRTHIEGHHLGGAALHVGRFTATHAPIAVRRAWWPTPVQGGIADPLPTRMATSEAIGRQRAGEHEDVATPPARA